MFHGRLLLFIAMLLSHSLAFAANRCNVIFIVADDLNCAIGAYGDDFAKTPNLDLLAQQGVVFEKAYCQQAVCNPSRSSFLTGIRPDAIKVDDLRKYFRNTAKDGHKLVTLPEHFKNHGYFCQDIGKIFHNMGETQDRQSWSIDETLYRGTHAADTVYFNTPVHLRKRNYQKKAPVSENLNVPDTAYRDGQIANMAAAMILQQPRGGQPFFLAVGFWRPHLPFVAPKRYWDLHDPNEIPLPILGAPPKDVPSIAMHSSREIRGYGATPQDRDFNSDEIRHLRHGYYASISFLDAQVGKILSALQTSGHAQNTLIVFTSDHGFHIGEKALWGKTSNFELDARVPLIISDPRIPATHGVSASGLVELIDLYPTLASLAGIPTRDKQINGNDFSSALSDPTRQIKTAAFTQHPQPFYGNRSQWKGQGYSVRTSAWRYTEWRSTLDRTKIIGTELYDHRIDPHESKNVAKQNAAEALRHSMILRSHFGL